MSVVEQLVKDPKLITDFITEHDRLQDTVDMLIKHQIMLKDSVRLFLALAEETNRCPKCSTVYCDKGIEKFNEARRLGRLVLEIDNGNLE